MVTLQAVFVKAQTTVDAAWRLTFDLPEYASEDVASLAQLRKEPLFLVVMTEQEYMERQTKPE
jgi:hypothetical protein